MKSVVVCGSKRYKDEIAVFCVELEKLGVLVFEPDFSEVMLENTTVHSASLYLHSAHKPVTLVVIR